MRQQDRIDKVRSEVRGVGFWMRRRIAIVGETVKTMAREEARAEIEAERRRAKGV